MVSLTACTSMDVTKGTDFTEEEIAIAEKNLKKITDMLGQYKIITAKKQFRQKNDEIIKKDSTEPYADLMPISFIEFIPENETPQSRTKTIIFVTFYNIHGREENNYALKIFLDEYINGFTNELPSNAQLQEAKYIPVKSDSNSPDKNVNFAKFRFLTDLGKHKEHVLTAIYSNKGQLQNMIYVKKDSFITVQEERKIDNILHIFKQLYQQSG